MCWALVLKQKPEEKVEYMNRGTCINRGYYTFRSTYLYMGLLISLFIIIASNMGPSRTTNSIIRWIRESKFLQEKHS